MKENIKENSSDEQSSTDNDQLRSNTMNETIREVSGDADANLTNMKGSTQSSESSDAEGTEVRDNTARMGNNYNPQDASGVRSGGTADMGNQTVGGAGSNNAHRPGSGSNLTTKQNVTGSDFDGQNTTS